MCNAPGAEAYRALSLTAAAERILSAERPLILTHVRPDGDTYASAVALADIFALLGKPAAITCADPIPERLRFIGDYAVSLRPLDDGYGTVIAVDVASPQQLGALSERYTPVLMLDHHASAVPFADYYSVPDASAAGEVIYALACVLRDMGKLPAAFPRPLVDALYAAISSDSGCFRYANTTASTHRIAAELLLAGADAAAINHRLFEEKPLSQLRADAMTAERITLSSDGRIAVAVITDKDRRAAGLSDDDFDTAIDVVRGLRGVTVAAVAKEKPDVPCEYKTSLRSTGVDVAAVAAAFGGGGHIRAAGCVVTGATPDDVLKLLFRALGQ